MKASIGLAVVVLLIAANPCTEAQNLIVNGNFDSDISGWTPLGASLSADWDPSDYDGSPNSGSLLGTNDWPSSANFAVVSCVDSISDGQPYQYTGWIKTPLGQTVTGLFQLTWYWYSLPSCAGTQTLAASTPYMTSADDWTYVSTDSEIAPAGTMSAYLVLRVYKTSAVPGTFQVYYDGLDFRDTSIIFADGFETGDTTAWSSVIGLVPLVTLLSGEGYDFSEETVGSASHGDFYFFYQSAVSRFWANNAGMRGLVDLGVTTGSLEDITVPASGYNQFGVEAILDHTYVSLAEEGEDDYYIIFRVWEVSSTETTLEWIYVYRP